jgi:hypothetical protein
MPVQRWTMVATGAAENTALPGLTAPAGLAAAAFWPQR